MSPLCLDQVTFPLPTRLHVDLSFLLLWKSCLLKSLTVSARVTLHVVVVLMCFWQKMSQSPQLCLWSSLFSCFAFSWPVGVFPFSPGRWKLHWALPWGGRIKTVCHCLSKLVCQTMFKSWCAWSLVCRFPCTPLFHYCYWASNIYAIHTVPDSLVPPPYLQFIMETCSPIFFV